MCVKMRDRHHNHGMTLRHNIEERNGFCLNKTKQMYNIDNNKKTRYQ